MTNMDDEIQKIKFHIRMIGESIDNNSNPITVLVIDLNWNETDLDEAHDIFEKYDTMLNKEEKVNWTEFEQELRKRFKIGYQEVKRIVLAFYRNHQWGQVCYGYASAHDCVEFHEITKSE
jgi:hypothetical protein